MDRKTYNLIESVCKMILENDSQFGSNITWRFCHKLKNKAVLDKIESMFNFSIPEDLKDIIIKYNAGSPDKNIFDRPTRGRVFSNLLSFNKDDDDNVYTIIIAIHGSNKLSLLPFGSDGFGNAICITKNGNVVFWSHEEESVQQVATSFNKFLSMLHK